MKYLYLMSDRPSYFMCSNSSVLPGAQLILHAHKPLFIAEIKKFSSQADLDQFIVSLTTTNFPYYSLFKKSYNILVVKFELVEGQLADVPAKRLQGLLDRMNNWFVHSVSQSKSGIGL